MPDNGYYICEYCGNRNNRYPQSCFCSTECSAAAIAVYDDKLPPKGIKINREPPFPLKPCKRCGGEAWLSHGADGKWYVSCIRKHNQTARYILRSRAIIHWQQSN